MSLQDTAVQMAEAIRHRGPDGGGSWSDAACGIALAHRRLSIVDLSQAGQQPMLSGSGRFVISFNGEIYNHRDLRVQLEKAGVAIVWRGGSDTETLLAAIDHWGLEGTLPRLVGMFAFALWDRRQRLLSLARDRFGEKPLYYGWASGSFVFASELKALRVCPGFSNELSRQALEQYFRLMTVPSPYSIYQGLFKLPPGCLLTVAGEPPSRAPATPMQVPGRYHSVRLTRWWCLADIVAAGVSDPFKSESEALDALDDALQESIHMQSRADVPVGTFLSGGLDSSLVAALMSQQERQGIETFTLGFSASGYDETVDARKLAKRLGCQHRTFQVTADDALGVIQRLPWMYDEPFADSSQIPTHLLCRAAKAHVTVALTGDAGDELFGGYNRYTWGALLWQCLRRLPESWRLRFSKVLQETSPGFWDRVLGHRLVVRPGEKLLKLSRTVRDDETLAEFYGNLVSEGSVPGYLLSAVAGANDEMTGKQGFTVPTEVGAPDYLLSCSGCNTAEARSRMMYWDSKGYLPDDILCKLDRAAMAASLETRMPFLDHRVAALAWKMPISMKIRGMKGKRVLRSILDRHVPGGVIRRPKSGFSIPLGTWMRGPLCNWADSLLDADRLAQNGYLDPVPILEAWSQHRSGQNDWTSQLWRVLMFQAWLDAYHGSS